MTCAGAQDVIISIIQPVDQERLCPDQPVTFQCHIPAGSGILIWSTPNGPLTTPNTTLTFTAVNMIGDTKDSSDEKFIATLTDRSSDDMVVFPLFTSTLMIQSPLDSLNNTIVNCDGGVPNDQINLILSGKYLVYIHVDIIMCIYIVHVCICKVMLHTHTVQVHTHVHIMYIQVHVHIMYVHVASDFICPYMYNTVHVCT